MFYEPQPSRYDLNFQVLGIPVRINPMFWVLTIFLGPHYGGASVLILWILAVTASILLHELGHALAMRHYGIHPWIVLYSFGGLTIAPRGYCLRWFENAFISFAGPAAGFVLAGILWLLCAPASIPSPHLRIFVYFLLEINVFWGVLNLLPIFPLDGGQIVRETAGWFLRERGFIFTLKISLVTALILIGGALAREQYFLAIMFAWMAFSNYQLLKQFGVRFR